MTGAFVLAVLFSMKRGLCLLFLWAIKPERYTLLAIAIERYTLLAIVIGIIG